MAVDTLITQARTDADTLIQTGNQFLEEIKELAQFELDEIPENGLANLVEAGQGAYNDAAAAVHDIRSQRPPRPAYPSIQVAVPSAPVIASIPNIDTETVPAFEGVAPVLNLPVIPEVVMPSDPGSAPEFRAPAIPDAPSGLLPTAPSFGPISFPEPPTLSVPAFTRSAPIESLVIPSTEFSFAEQAYTSALMDSLSAKLLSDLENGGYGLETDDELQIWARLREREAREAAGRIEEVSRNHAALGWPKPTGALFSDIERIRREARDKSAEINRDIATKRAELFQEHRKFTIEQARSLETTLLQYHGSVQERSLNAAKATVDAAIALYDASVKKFTVQLDLYKSEATVYEARIRALATQADIYRTQIAAVEAQTKVQQNQVEIYKAQLAGVETASNIYRTRMEGAGIAAQIEKARLDGFRASVESYVAQVQAKVAQFNAYKAKIEGEVARVTAFEAEVRAHGERVNVAKTNSEIAINVLKTRVDTAKLDIEKYQTDILKYRTELENVIARINAANTEYASDVQAYIAIINSLIRAFDLKVEGNKIYLDAAKADTTDKIERAKLRFQELQAAADIRMKAGGFGSTFIGNQITAALNTINTLAAQVENL